MEETAAAALSPQGQRAGLQPRNWQVPGICRAGRWVCQVRDSGRQRPAATGDKATAGGAACHPFPPPVLGLRQSQVCGHDPHTTQLTHSSAHFSGFSTSRVCDHHQSQFQKILITIETPHPLAITPTSILPHSQLWQPPVYFLSLQVACSGKFM